MELINEWSPCEKLNGGAMWNENTR